MLTLAFGVIGTTPIPSEAVFVLAQGWISAIVLRMPQAERERPRHDAVAAADAELLQEIGTAA